MFSRDSCYDVASFLAACGAQEAVQLRAREFGDIGQKREYVVATLCIRDRGLLLKAHDHPLEIEMK